MNANPDFTLQQIGNLYFIFPKQPKHFPTVQDILTTNETGACIWNILQTPVTKPEIITALCSEYEIDDATASADLDSFLNGLNRIGALC
jgi:hypothetical protein